jgi:hypothetical protein
MILDRTDTPRATLLARGEVLPVVDQYLTQVMKQEYASIPVITGLPGSGRSAVLLEIGQRQSVIGRSVGYGSVKTGLGQALIDATASLSDAIAIRRPGSRSLSRVIKAGEEFMAKAPDEGTVAVFSQAVDFLLYALSNEVTEIQGGFLILLDDLDRANESRLQVLIEGLVALAQTGAPIPVVFARMQDRPGKRLGPGMEEIALRRLANADFADLAERTGLSADGEGIKVLAEYSQGLPGPAIEILAHCAGNPRLTASVVTQAISRYEAAQAAMAPIPEPVASQASAESAGHVRGDVGSERRVGSASGEEISAVDIERPRVGGMKQPVSTASLPTNAPASDGLPRRSPRLSEPVAPPQARTVLTPPVVAPAPIVALRPVELTPTQKRCVETIVEMSVNGDPVTLAYLRRRLGDVSRFGGGATPVVNAVKELVGLDQVVHSTDDIITLTPGGHVTVASLATN